MFKLIIKEKYSELMLKMKQLINLNLFISKLINQSIATNALKFLQPQTF